MSAKDDPFFADTHSGELFAAPTPLGGHRSTTSLGEIDHLFTDASLFSSRNINTLARMKELCLKIRQRNRKIVLTNGSFDILHIGHSIYLERARSFGDFLIVGVDSDAKIRERKGPGRPLVPEMERLKMLTFQRGVGAVFLKQPDHKRWTLIKHVRPDVLVVTADTYTAAEIATIESKFKCQVKVLPRMATVSSSGRLRTAQMGEAGEELAQPLPIELPPAGLSDLS